MFDHGLHGLQTGSHGFRPRNHLRNSCPRFENPCNPWFMNGRGKFPQPFRFNCKIQDDRGPHKNAPASWTAAVLCRFCSLKNRIFRDCSMGMAQARGARASRVPAWASRPNPRAGRPCHPTRHPPSRPSCGGLRLRSPCAANRPQPAGCPRRNAAGANPLGFSRPVTATGCASAAPAANPGLARRQTPHARRVRSPHLCALRTSALPEPARFSKPMRSPHQRVQYLLSNPTSCYTPPSLL
jgi:hypothetical protein